MKYPPHKISFISHKTAAKSKITIKRINHYIFTFFAILLFCSKVAYANNWKEVNAECHVMMESSVPSVSSDKIFAIKWTNESQDIKVAKNDGSNIQLNIAGMSVKLDKLRFDNHGSLVYAVGRLNIGTDNEIVYEIIANRSGVEAPLKVIFGTNHGDIKSLNSVCRFKLVDGSKFSLYDYPSTPAFDHYNQHLLSVPFPSTVASTTNTPIPKDNVSYNKPKNPHRAEEIKFSKDNEMKWEGLCLGKVPADSTSRIANTFIHFKWEVVPNEVDGTTHVKWAINEGKYQERLYENNMNNFTGNTDVKGVNIQYRVNIDRSAADMNNMFDFSDIDQRSKVMDKMFNFRFKETVSGKEYVLSNQVCKIITNSNISGHDMYIPKYYPNMQNFSHASLIYLKNQ